MGMSADATIGWGVSLGNESGEDCHESIEDKESVWETSYKEQYSNLEVRFAGDPVMDCGYPVVFVSRTTTNSGWGHEEVDPETLTPPLFGEGFLMAKFLDEIAFKGDGKLKLLVIASYG